MASAKASASRTPRGKKTDMRPCTQVVAEPRGVRYCVRCAVLCTVQCYSAPHTAPHTQVRIRHCTAHCTIHCTVELIRARKPTAHRTVKQPQCTEQHASRTDHPAIRPNLTESALPHVIPQVESILWIFATRRYVLHTRFATPHLPVSDLPRTKGICSTQSATWYASASGELEFAPPSTPLTRSRKFKDFIVISPTTTPVLIEIRDHRQF